MQKKIYLLASLLVFIAFSLKGQQPALQASVYNDVLLDSAGGSSTGSCLPLPDFNIVVDSSLLPFATGMTVVAVITELSSSQPSSIVTSHGLLAIGDTLPFDTTDTYPIYFYSDGSLKWEWRAMGIPTQPEEEYSCSFNVLFTLAWCDNNIVLLAEQGAPDCVVGIFGSIEDGKSLGWELYPSPSQGPMRLRHKDGLTQWESAALLDIQGRTLRRWEAGEEINTTGMEAGIYFLRATSEERPFVFRIMVE